MMTFKQQVNGAISCHGGVGLVDLGGLVDMDGGLVDQDGGMVHMEGGMADLDGDMVDQDISIDQKKIYITPSSPNDKVLLPHLPLSSNVCT
jgi:hypothetical protein